MDIHKNARSCPASRALLIERVRAGCSVAEAGEALGMSARRCREWVRRAEAGQSLEDRPSRPRRTRQIARWKQRTIVQLRRQRLTCRQIARRVGCSVATVARVVGRAGLSRLRSLDAPPPTVRYERAEPGDLLHLDTKKLGRIRAGVGHRITGRAPKKKRYAGWEFLHVCIDDHSRLSYVEVLGDERKHTAAGFLRRAVAWFDERGVSVRRVLTDNGACYVSTPFAAVCRELSIRHYKTRPYTPRTNGKAERFIQTLLREWAYRFAYRSSPQRQRWLGPYLHFYNHHRAHSALSDQPPITRLTRNNVLRRDS